MTDQKANIALLGLGVMGQSLALNMERNGYRVAVYNRSPQPLHEFIEGPARDKNFVAVPDLSKLPDVLETPRRIVLMVTAGKPVDALIEVLLPHLEKGDILIDGGNSLYLDTTRRTQYLTERGIRYIGAGVSGGEEGALWGPSIMPGGNAEAWPYMKQILQDIAAKTPDGTPCCDWIGPDGAGHFVKMVHNGIEYADMQLITEAYYLMKHALGMDNAEMAATFKEWNEGELDSYLIGSTADILGKLDPETGKPLVDLILDAATQKGTGKWTVEASLDFAVPTMTIAEAVFFRLLSGLKEQRVAAEKVFGVQQKRYTGDKKAFVNALRDALFASKLCAYAQGFALMKAASDALQWNLDYGRIALLWREGCIIRARFLDRIKQAYDRDPQLPNLLLDPFFRDSVKKGLDDWRMVICTAVGLACSVPAFTSALSYFDGYTHGQSGANLIQALRDYFGAHTYLRTDQEGVFHADWMNLPSIDIHKPMTEVSPTSKEQA